MASEPRISIVIAARNEEGLIGATLDAALRAACYPSAELRHLDATDCEVLVVDNRSTDGTAEVVAGYARRWGVRLLHSEAPRAPAARNDGARAARGALLVFVDADTLMPERALERFRALAQAGYQAGITGLASLEGGARAWCWWAFWCQVRRLPLARAKAMPALMFCTRALFDALGPFDEAVAIGEEWPLLAGLYRAQPARLAYERGLVALTSSRRMELQRFGYTRTLLRYVWAVLHPSGRVAYSDRWRYTPGRAAAGPRAPATVRRPAE